MLFAQFASKYLKTATATHKVGGVSWISRGARWIPALALVLGGSGCATEVNDQSMETRVTASTTESQPYAAFRKARAATTRA